MFEYIFFDLDGTLTNSMEGIFKSLIYAFNKLNLPVPSEDTLRKFIGPPLTVSFREIMGYGDELTEKAIEAYRERYTVKGIYENFPFPGMEQLLKEVSDSGKILAVATSKPEFMSVKVIEHFGLDKYFATVSGSINESQDKAAVIEQAISRLSLTDDQRKDILMIGDRKHDLIGAKKCGVKCCGVNYGFAPEGELIEYGADYIVDTVEDLKNFLLNH